MSFAVGCVYYNDVKSLERLLDSTTDQFDYCLMIDGRFFAHRGEPLSTDGSRELMNSYDNIISLDLPDLTEAQKRNGYLWLCKEHNIEWLLILDSDEYVTTFGDWKYDVLHKMDLVHNHYIYDIQSRRFPADYVKYDPRPRLWYDPEGFEYTTCHCCYHRKDKKERFGERPCIDNIFIEHDKSLRTQNHTIDWSHFIAYQLDAESQVGVSL